MCSKLKEQGTYLKKDFLLKNANHDLSCQQVITADHRLPTKENNNEKVGNIARITKMWHRDTCEQMLLEKMAPMDFLDAGLPHTSNLLKKQQQQKLSICEGQ